MSNDLNTYIDVIIKDGIELTKKNEKIVTNNEPDNSKLQDDKNKEEVAPNKEEVAPNKEEVAPNKEEVAPNKEDDTLWLPEVVVLGPGGSKGFLELGSLLLLEEYGILNNVDTYVGCSIGSIISLLIIAGYDVAEIIKVSIDTNLFNDLATIDISQIANRSGLIDNKTIKHKLTVLLTDKFGYVPNLQELYIATNYEFCIVAFNLTKYNTEYITRYTEPELSCIEAVLLSSNIPAIFYKIQYNGSIYVDGAIGNPLPVDIYDNGKTNILALNIDTYNYKYESTDESNIAYLISVMNATSFQLKKRIINGISDKCKIINLNYPSSSVMNITSTQSDALSMIDKGICMSKRFLFDLKYKNYLEEDNDEEIPIILSSTLLTDIDCNKIECDMNTENTENTENTSGQNEGIEDLNDVYIITGDELHKYNEFLNFMKLDTKFSTSSI